MLLYNDLIGCNYCDTSSPHNAMHSSSYTTMRCCAQFHHNKLVKEATATVSEEDVHRYHLGSIALCLFCESTYVKFDFLPDNWDRRLAFFTGLVNPDFVSQLQQLAIQGFQFKDVIPITICIKLHVQQIPQQKELIWENEHYDAMNRAREEKDDKFIKLLNEDKPTPVSISNYRNEENLEPFPYEYAYFNDALKALQTSLLPLIPGTITETKAPYYIKKFHNETSKSEGRMKCFHSWPSGDITYEYAEMRIIIDDPPQNSCPPQISRCRFVYQYYHKRRQCVGTLYFTDSHYGWDLIAEDDINETLKNRRGRHEIERNELESLLSASYFEKQDELLKIKKDLYRLQDKIEGIFPFQPIGILRIWEDKYTLT